MKRFFQKTLKFIGWFLVIYFSSTLLLVIAFRFVPPPVTPLMVIRLVEQAYQGEPLRMNKSWVSIDKISPNLQLAVVASEDNRFLEHSGFDMEAIEKAREYNKRKQGRATRGASTITQQTAKNLFLWPQRSWIRKGLEAYFTVVIELVWSKQRIMEVYLNIIETGNGIYGAEAAAQEYFKKSAKSLTRGESALIAAMLPNPLKWNPAFPTTYLRGRQQWILWNMGNIGQINY